jgi:hypothetical protein
MRLQITQAPIASVDIMMHANTVSLDDVLLAETKQVAARASSASS